MSNALIMLDDYAKACMKLGPSYRARIKAFENKIQTKGLERSGLHVEIVKATGIDGLRSVRVDDDIRAMVLVAPLALLYIDHHDDAYDWARRSSMEVKPTGERILYRTEDAASAVTEAAQGEPRYGDVFARFDDSYLSDTLGVPMAFVPVVRNLKDEEGLLELGDQLPADVVERLIDLAAGGVPTLPPALSEPGELAGSPEPILVGGHEASEDAQLTLDVAVQASRREWLSIPSAKQRRLAVQQFDRPVVLTGPAGTGKTVVLLHRAASVAKTGGQVLLLTTGSTMARSLRSDIDLLAGAHQWRSAIDVTYLWRLLTDLSSSLRGSGLEIPDAQMVYWGEAVAAAVSHAIEVLGDELDEGEARNLFWYQDEWQLVLEPWAVTDLSGYLAVERTGRGQALSRGEREKRWRVFDSALETLAESGHVPQRVVLRAVLDRYRADTRLELRRWDAVLVDEMQDCGPAVLELARLLAKTPGGLMLGGDPGQRLYIPSVTAGLGERPIRKQFTRSYRTTQPIMRFVQEELGLGDPDSRAVGSRASGPPPEVRSFRSWEAEVSWVCDYLRSLDASLGDVGVLAPTKEMAGRVLGILSDRGIPCVRVSEACAAGTECVSVGHYHVAKGLEFGTVIIVGIRSSDLEPTQFDWMPADQRDEKITLKRNVMYVALTRAREKLVITGVEGEMPGVLMRSARRLADEQGGSDPGGTELSEFADLDDAPF